MHLRKINLDHVPLWRYQQYMATENPSEEDLLKCFLDLNSAEIKQLPFNQIDLYLDQITNLLQQDQPLTRVFKMGGIKYGFIPRLDDITYGENADVTKYIVDYGSMHKAMAVLYRPIKQKIRDKYLIEDYEGSYQFADKMKYMPLSVALGAIVFFYNLTNDLLNCIPKYLDKEMKNLDSTQQAYFQKSGQGIQSSMRLVRETLGDLIQSPK